MNFTQAQSSAINERNASLIVSAGAGSGKTAVLTERIVTRLCDENDACNITDLLVVTFTKAAAKEMSDRIRKKLSERACENPSNKKILRNLSLLPLAKICTIDSFCFDLVKSNFQKLGLSASLRMMDEAEAEVIRNRIMNEVVDDAFSQNEGEPEEDFILAYEIFSGSKSDESFVSILLDLDTKLECCVSREKFASDTFAMYDSVMTGNEYFDTLPGKFLKDTALSFCDKALMMLEQAYSLCLDGDALEAKYAPKIEADALLVKHILSEIPKGYEKVRGAVLSFKKERLGIVKDYYDAQKQENAKNIKNAAGDTVKNLMAIFTPLYEDIKLCAADTKRVITELIRLTDEFHKRHEEHKKSLGILDFNDCAHYALGLLCDSTDPVTPSDLAIRMRREYKEIYIDEYQDVNELQDAIFLALSNTDENGVENSRFMVGDVKQSIYGFRGARPGIFNNYRNTFDTLQSNSPTKKIYMSDNFRCSENIIAFTNLLFSRLMGRNYNEGDALIYSRVEQNKVNEKVKLLQVDLTDISDDPDVASEEYEAREVGKRILSLVNNPEHLSSEGKVYTFSDVAVLTRAKKVHEAYERVFSDMGIPVFADAGEKFYSRKEIKLALCILNSIDNPERDIYVTGFLRSCIAGFTDDELCIIRHKREKMSMYRALVKYAEENEGEDNGLCEKCKAFIERLSRYRALSRNRNAYELVWEVFTDTDMLNLCASRLFGVKNATDGENARKNLLKLYNLAVNYSSTSFRGIGDFLEYVNACKEKDNTKADRILSENSVQLMTIHRSKGLEFPVCFVADTNHGFNSDKGKLKFSFDDGMASVLRDVKGISCADSLSGNISISTPFAKFIDYKNNIATYEEEMRTLYVALTRAKDILYVVTCYKKFDMNKLFLTGNMYKEYSEAGSFIDAINMCISKSDVLKGLYETLAENGSIENVCLTDGLFEDDKFSECLEIIHVKPTLVSEEENMPEVVVEVPSDAEVYKADDALLKKLHDNDTFSYRNILMTKIPSKLTVSMLKTGLLDDEQTSADDVRNLRTEPLFLSQTDTVTAADKGTAMHMFMQFANYEKCENGCKAEADRLFDEGFIDRIQRDVLDIETLDKFFASDFYGRIKGSNAVYREKRFNILFDVGDYTHDECENDEKILVQGVIDLYFENSDGTYTVVDFKTDRVRKEDGEEVLRQRHSKQLEYYCRAVSEITGKPVGNAYIFSFALMKEIEVQF